MAELDVEIAAADAEVLRAQQWLRKNNPNWRPPPNTTMSPEQLSKWMKLDGEPKAALVNKLKGLVAPMAELDKLMAEAAEAQAAGRASSASLQQIKTLESRINAAFDSIPNEVAWRFRERIRRVLQDQGAVEGLKVFENKLSRFYNEGAAVAAPGFAVAEAGGIPQMAAAVTSEWLPGGARAAIPEFVVQQAFRAPWDMTLSEFTIEWNSLRARLGGRLPRRMRERLTRGEITERDLRRLGKRTGQKWTPSDIADLERLRQMAGQHNPWSAPQPRYVLKDLKRLHKNGLAGAEENAALRAAANADAIGAAKNIAQATRQEISKAASELRAAEKRGAGARSALEDVYQAVETETTAARLPRQAQYGDAGVTKLERARRRAEVQRRGVSADVAELMDRALMWQKVEAFFGHVMRFSDPFTAATQAWRYRNNWIDNYGLAEGAVPFKSERLHEWTMAQRYWTRNRNNANLAARRALQREAEAEVTEFQFRAQQYLKEVSEYDVYQIAAGDTLDSIAARYATTLKPKWRIKQEIVRDNKLDLVRRNLAGSTDAFVVEATSKVPDAFATAEKATKQIEMLITEHGADFWHHLPRSFVFQKQDLLRAIMESATSRGSVLNIHLMRKYKDLDWSVGQKLSHIDGVIRAANKGLRAEISELQNSVKNARLDPERLVLEAGEVLRVRDLRPKQMKARQKTVFDALHYEHAEVVANVTRDAHAPSGSRFAVREGAPNAEGYESWVRIANKYDMAVDLSKELTLQSLQMKLLRNTDNLYEIWASNWYSSEGRRAATKKRLEEKIVDQKVLRNYKQMTKRQKKAFDKEWDTWLSEELRTFQTVETNLYGHQTFEGLKGAAERKRKLGDPESGISIEDRIGQYGMSGELQDLVMNGMMNQKRDIATARMWKRMSEDNTMFSRVKKQGWYEVNNSTIAGTDLRKFGTELPDKFYLHPDIYWDFKGMGIMQKQTSHPLVKALSYWKAMKTALNPAVHATNILSNLLFLGPMHGLSPWDPRALRSMQMASKEFVLGARSKHYQAWINSGGSPAGALNRIEMVTDAQQAFGHMMFGAINRGKEGIRIGGEMFKSTVTGNWKGAGKAFKQLNYDLPGLAYSAGDDFFRFSLFLLKTGRYMGKAKRANLIKQGRIKFLKQAYEGEAKLGVSTGRGAGGYYQFLDDAYAAQLGRRAFARYEEMAGFMRLISTHWLGKPFLAFDATTIPMMFEWLKAKPLQARMWMQMYESMTDINFRKSNMTEERAKAMKEELPDYAENKMAMVRQFFPELAESSDGAENYFNALKYGIGGRLLRQKDESTGQWLQRVGGSEHPMFSVFLYGVMDEHPYFHTKLPEDDPQKWKWGGKMWDHFWQTVSPSYAPGGYAWQRISDSGFRFWGPDELGRPRYGRGIDEKPWQAFLAVGLGVDLKEFDPLLRSEQQFEEHEKAGRRTGGGSALDQIKALKKRYAKNKERYASTPAELRVALQDLYAVARKQARDQGRIMPEVTPQALDKEVAESEAARHYTLENMIQRFGARRQIYKTLGRDTAYDIQRKQVQLKSDSKRRKALILRAKKAAFGADDWTGFKDVFSLVEEQAHQNGEGWADEHQRATYEAIINTMNKRKEFARAAQMVRELELVGDDALDSAIEMDKDYNLTTWYDRQIIRIARARRRHVGRLKRGE